jgi:hypothetical protein
MPEIKHDGIADEAHPIFVSIWGMEYFSHKCGIQSKTSDKDTRNELFRVKDFVPMIK